MKAITLILVGWYFAIQTHAATRIWEGDVSPRWSDGFNWSPIGEPQPGDDLVFPVSSSPTTISNDMVGLRVRSLTFDKVFRVQGNSLTITHGITCSHSGGNVVIEMPLTLGGDQRFFTEDDDLQITGTVTLGGFDLTLRGDNNFLVSLLGPVTGNGNIIVAPEGAEAELGGHGDNDFIGTLRVESAATLYLSKLTGEAVRTRLEIIAGTVKLRGHNEIRDGASVLIDRGVLLLDGHIEFLGGDVELRDGPWIDSGASSGILNLSSARVMVAAGSAWPARITGRVGLRSNTSGRPTEFAIGPGPSPSLNIAADVSGDKGFIMYGAGVMRLSGTNTFAGEAVISQGTVEAMHSTAFGATTGGTTLSNHFSGGKILLQNVNIIGEPLTVAEADGSLVAINACSWTGPITLNADLSVQAVDAAFTGAILNLAGQISGPGGHSGVAFWGRDRAAFGTGTKHLQWCYEIQQPLA